MSTQRFLLLCLLAGVLALPAQARNVLLIISDDQGMDVGVYGNQAIKTPVLDQLARDGTQFLQGFATVSSCSPSRSVLLTGLFTHTNGMYGLAHHAHNFHLREGVETLPEWLKQAGYRTALVGKHHLKPETAFPFDAHLAPEKPGNRDVAFMAQELGKFVTAEPDRPFFVVLGYSDPHRAPENFGNTQEWPGIVRVTYRPEEVEVPKHLPDLPGVRADLAEHYESISRLDSGVGLVLDELEAAGRRDDTLIIYVSDNGRPFAGAKGTLYETGIHLPLIVWSPDQLRRGVQNHALTSWVDVVPTILDWTDTPGPSDYELHGRSLLPILEQEKPSGWDEIFASHTFHEVTQYYPTRVIRTERYKYLLNLEPELEFPLPSDVVESPSWEAIQAAGAGLGSRPLEVFLHRPAEELYDLEQDPQELNNLASDPRYSETLEKLRARLKSHRARTQDPWLEGQLSPHGDH